MARKVPVDLKTRRNERCVDQSRRLAGLVGGTREGHRNGFRVARFVSTLRITSFDSQRSGVRSEVGSTSPDGYGDNSSLIPQLNRPSSLRIMLECNSFGHTHTRRPM